MESFAPPVGPLSKWLPVQRGLVTVIIPTFEAKWCVAEAVESALAQTYPHVQIVVVDDGSTDGTLDFLARRYGPKLTAIRRQNGGLAAARNTGLAAAKGEFIQFLDADDVIADTKLEIQVDYLSSRARVDSVTCRAADFYDTPSAWSKVRYPSVSRLMPDLIRANVVGVVHGPLTRRAALELSGGFDESFGNYCADWDLWIRLALHGCEFDCVDEVMAFYRRHGTSLTKRKVLPNAIGDLRVTEKAVSFCRKNRLYTQSDLDSALADRYLEVAKWAVSEVGILLAVPWLLRALLYSNASGRSKIARALLRHGRAR